MWLERLGLVTSIAVLGCSQESPAPSERDATLPQDIIVQPADRQSTIVDVPPIETIDVPSVDASIDASSDAGFVVDAIRPPTLTYWHDTEPIFRARCVTCHRPGGIMAAMPWDSYGRVFDFRTQIQTAIVENRMPPWPPSSFCGPHYQNDLSLTPEQINKIRDWVAMGAEEGSPADRGERLTPTSHTTLSRVDSSLALPPYVPPVTEEYRCFVMDWPGTAAQYITGMQVDPGIAQIVHHALIYKIGGDPSDPHYSDFFDELDRSDLAPGFSCTGTTGILRLNLLGAWAPGNQGADFPVGTGLPIPPHTKIVAQIHYNTTGVASLAMLRSLVEAHPIRLNFRLDDRVSHVAQIRYWTDSNWVLDPMAMLIPAGSRGVTHSYTGFLRSGTVYGVSTHQHQLGRSNRLSHITTSPTGETTESCLLDIPRWDFHWQDVFWLQSPVTFRSGDQLRITCGWDNPTSRDVSWGDSTSAEMCLGLIYYVPDGS